MLLLGRNFQEYCLAGRLVTGDLVHDISGGHLLSNITRADEGIVGNRETSMETNFVGGHPTSNHLLGKTMVGKL